MPACSGGFHLQCPVGGPGGLAARGNQLSSEIKVSSPACLTLPNTKGGQPPPSHAKSDDTTAAFLQFLHDVQSIACRATLERRENPSITGCPGESMLKTLLSPG